MPDHILVIACGALAREIEWLKRHHGWHYLQLQCLDAALHNHPEDIPARVEALLEQSQGQFGHTFVAYADCGTGGQLDKVLARWQVERLPGAHCYEFFATSPVFDELAETEPGTFYLTDFLARHFDRLVIDGLKLDKHPELEAQFFGHYRKLMYLAQSDNPELLAAAERAAERLGLHFERLFTDMGDLAQTLESQVLRWQGGHHAAN